MDINTILGSVDTGAMALPEFQRGYVWNRDQVRRFMTSLYHRYPVGSLLVWVTNTEKADMRGGEAHFSGAVELILDGQQRITSLYGIMRGNPPPFFEGNANAFTGLYFHLLDETFEFYAPIKMRHDPLWIDVTELMLDRDSAIITRLLQVPELQEDIGKYLARINRVTGIGAVEFYVQKVAGEDKSVDVVVEIFNNVNSGGTKLSKGDLALAKICAQWPEAREEMRARLERWEAAGFSFRLEWLLRCVNAVVTGEALFTALKDISTEAFARGLRDAEKAVDTLLNVISSRLGLDHDLVLGSRYSFPVLARYLIERGGRLDDHTEWDKLLYWYIQTFLWGRYAGSTETVLNQDLALIEDPNAALDQLIAQIGRQYRTELTAEDFAGWSRSARFFPLLYMLTRVSGSQDWESGVALSKYLLGKGSALELHHIFPKSLLYKHGYSRPEVNAIANFTFLTKETNVRIGDRAPADYLPEYAAKHPGALESHWIPMDPTLWNIESYREFLAARRQLLADTANAFLNSLLHGSAPEAPIAPLAMEAEQPPSVITVAFESEQALLRACQEWVKRHGLPPGEYRHELTDPDTDEPLATLDLAWPHGLQEGLSQPVAILLEEDEIEGLMRLLHRAGFTYFTDIPSFQDYVQREILSEAEEVA